MTTVEKATDLLFFLHAQGQPCGVTVVSRQLGLPKASAHRLLRSLTQASQISSGLFRPGQNHPDVHFSIYPIPSRGLRMVRFEASGQQMIYQNEPQEWRHFKWPGDEQMPLAVIGGTTSGNRALGKLDFSGDWSLFHLLKQAKITNDPDGYMLAWDLESGPGHTLTVQLKLRPDRDSNIFVSGLFSDFRLPATIF